MAKSREHFALDWIKSELLATLNAARQGLEAFAEGWESGDADADPADDFGLRACSNGLHQIHGTLVMLQLEGVTLLADHLERVTERLREGSVADVGAACQSLMQGILEFPGHLDELQNGGPDSVGSVLGLVNDLRSHLGENAIELGAGVAQLHGVAGPAALRRFETIDGAEKTRKIRSVYQQMLLTLLKGGSVSRAADNLRKVAQGMMKVCEGTPFEGLWQAFSEFVESLVAEPAAGGGPLDSDAVKLLRRADSEIREIAQHGVEALERPVPMALVRQLLDAAEARGHRSPRLSGLKDEAGRDQRSDGLALSGRQAMASAATALREELGTVKDRLDLFARGSEQRDARELEDLLAPLKQVASTLSLLGFESSKSIVQDQVETLTTLAETGNADDAAILNIAGALMQVDENLASLTQSGRGEAERITDEAQRAVAEQARQGLEQIKQYVVDYVSSQWDARHLQSAPQALDSMAGALRMIPLTQAAALVQRCEQYVRAELMAGHVPSWAELDLLADALSGIDYYLERLASGHAGGADDVLDLVQRSLDGLGAMAPDSRPAANVEPAVEPIDEPTEAPLASAAPDDMADSDIADSGVELVEGLSLVGSAPDPGVDRIGRSTDEFDVLVPEPAAEVEAEPEIEVEGEAGSEPEFQAESEPEAAPESEPDADDELAPEPAAATDTGVEPLFGHAEDVDVAAVGEGDEGSEPELALETEDDFDLSNALFDSIPGQAGVDASEDDDLAAHQAAPEATADAPIDAPMDEPLEEPVEAAPAAPAEPAALGLAATLSDTFDADAEIVEIFGEEVDEVLAAVDEHLAVWQADPADEALLTDIRRAFHTLKGSGRMVGANVLGEMAWSVENMLNRLLDGTVPASAEFAAVVAEARRLAPMLKDAFERRTAPPMDGVARVMEQADVLASGGSLADAGDEAETGHTLPAAQESGANEHQALFLEEAAALLADLRSSCGGQGFRLDDAALRALHTLSGSASMVGMPAIGDLVAPAYELAQAVRRPDGDTVLDGELGEFFRQVSLAIAEMLAAFAEGREAEDAFQLVAEADRLLLESEGDAAAADARLLALPALGTLLKAPEFLEAWKTGAVDMAFAETLQGALGEVADVAATEGHAGLAALARALAEAYQRFEFEALDERAWHAFAHAQEQMLAQVDAIAAQQQPQPVGPTIALLDVLMPEVAAEADLEPGFDDDAEPDFEAADDTVSFDDALAAADAPEAAPEDDLPAFDSDEYDVEELDLSAPELPATAASTDAAAVALPDEIDADIIGVFFEEADELLEAMDQGINDWSAEPDNRLHLENLLRALHTLKGGARLSGLSDLGDQVHQFESFLIEVQEGAAPVNAALFDALHERFDAVNHRLSRIREAVAAAGDPAAAAVVAPEVPETAAPPPAASTPPAEDAPVPAEPQVAATGNVQPLRPAAAAPQSSKPAAVAARRAADSAARESAAQEMVRVGAGLLEALVNLAGESSIIRARVEQGMSDFTSALDEMETTIERLREQLRRLEIETETQVLFRQERLDAPSYDEFDPLEMDRYSQLQQLSRSLSESASDMLDLKDTLLFKAREAETLLLQQARVNTELQEGLMRSRMVPFSRLLPRLRRTVRQVAKELDKSVELHAFNIEGELDRSLLERMVPPLEHMLRNAVDHGIEPTAERQARGKAEAGRIDLRLSREGGDVVIEISDDGAGIDVGRVRAKAVERGLMAADANLRDDEISQFVLAPGFSTARSVTQISGRGVGMDVVHSEVKQLGGSISINSEPGRGTRFVVRVPFTVSVNRALMVSVGDDLYAIPLNTIEGIVLLGRAELDGLYAPDGNTFEYAGVPYRVQYLGSFLGREYRPTPMQGSVPVVLVRSGEHAVAVHVDGVQGSREIVVKSLGPQFAGVGGISGATILGDGSVVVILDLLALIRAQAGGGAAAGKRALSGAPRTRSVMVVDDSVTVRKVTSRLLERQGMDVMVAKDGVEAVAMLQERRPDVMLLDIEMPRMDGFEVLRQVRHDARLRDLPVVMISSRTGAKHQDRAAELGVDRFLGKPFQESELLGTIDELVSRS